MFENVHSTCEKRKILQCCNEGDGNQTSEWWAMMSILKGDGYVRKPSTILWIDLLNASIFILMKIPIIISYLITTRCCRNHYVSLRSYSESIFVVHFVLVLLELTFLNGKNTIYSTICRYLFFKLVKMWSMTQTVKSFVKS